MTISVPGVRSAVRAALLLWPFVLACAPRRAAEHVLLRSHFQVTRDVRYDSGARHLLDVYRPKAHGQQAAPVVVFLYGGRWQRGSKEEYRLVGDAVTRRGFVAVMPDHRLYPEVQFPAWVDDAARVVRWVRDSIRGYGGDPSRIFVVGHSSGAHTVAILALDDQYLLRAGVTRDAVRGYVSMSGPVGTVWTDPDVQALMGPSERWPTTYPLDLATGGKQPLLLIHGREDRTVLPMNSVRLADRIRQRGGCSRAIVYRRRGHSAIAIAFAVPRFGIAPVLDDVVAFMRDPEASTCATAYAEPPHAGHPPC